MEQDQLKNSDEAKKVNSIEINNDTPLDENKEQVEGLSGVLIKKKPFYKSVWFLSVLFSFMTVLGVILFIVGYYYYALTPVDEQALENKVFDVKSGETLKSVAIRLENENLIRSKLVFLAYVKMNPEDIVLHAGDFELSKNMTVAEIYSSLGNATGEQIKVMIYPGSTIYDTRLDKDKPRTDIVYQLTSLGYSEKEVLEALSKNYDHPLLSSKPDDIDTLEGYLFGETIFVSKNSSVEEIITGFLDYYYDFVVENNLEEAAKENNLTLHELITLASVVEREVSGGDRKTVASVFYNRINKGMMLGSDVTFIYAAASDGKTPTVNYDSPYNTRVNVGLPPAAIANPGKDSLLATANPSESEYLYFVAGDDGITYFSKTLTEHESLVKEHCIELCAEF